MLRGLRSVSAHADNNNKMPTTFIVGIIRGIADSATVNIMQAATPRGGYFLVGVAGGGVGVGTGLGLPPSGFGK